MVKVPPGYIQKHRGSDITFRDRRPDALDDKSAEDFGNDILELSENISSVFGISSAEALTLAEVIVTTTIKVIDQPETLTFAEAVVVARAYSEAEVLSLADAIVINFTKVMSEAELLNLAEIVTSVLGRNEGETLSLAEAITLRMSENVSETLAFAEAILTAFGVGYGKGGYGKNGYGGVL